MAQVDLIRFGIIALIILTANVTALNYDTDLTIVDNPFTWQPDYIRNDKGISDVANNGSLQDNITRQVCSGNDKFSGFDGGTFTCTSDVLGNGTGVAKEGNTPDLYNDSSKMYLNHTTRNASIDGREECHDRIRGVKNSFRRTVSAIPKISKKIQKAIVTVMMKENIRDLDFLVRLASKLKTALSLVWEVKVTKKDIEQTKKMLGFKEGFSEIQTSKSNEYDVEFKEMYLNFKNAKRLANKLGVFLYPKPPVLNMYMKELYYKTLPAKKRLICTDLNTCRIDYKGNVIACFLIRKPMGNVLKKPLPEIWNSKEFRAFRKKLLAGNLLPICRTCCKLSCY